MAKYTTRAAAVTLGHVRRGRLPTLTACTQAVATSARPASASPAGTVTPSAASTQAISNGEKKSSTITPAFLGPLRSASPSLSPRKTGVMVLAFQLVTALQVGIEATSINRGNLRLNYATSSPPAISRKKNKPYGLLFLLSKSWWTTVQEVRTAIEDDLLCGKQIYFSYNRDFIYQMNY